MIKNRLLNKGIIFAIIVLLIGISVIPSTGNMASFDDNTPPVTTYTLDPPVPDGDNGWYVSDVEVTLNATDDMSGVNVTYYRINNGTWETYTEPFKVKIDGVHLVEFYSIDNAGNVEEVKSAGLKIDKTEPEGNWYKEILFRKVKYSAEVYDKTSGVDRVEFYLDCELWFTDYDNPYEWISDFTPEHYFSGIAFDVAGNEFHTPISQPPGNNHVKGLILNPKITEECITFFAIIVKYYVASLIPDYGLYILRYCKFRNDFSGNISTFWINATFYHHF